MSANNDDTLYHYTSIDGLNSILSSRKIWLSDCRFLNDRDEFNKAKDMFLSRFDGSLRDILEAAFHWSGRDTYHCVFSLSKSPEVLSQWRTYADNGRGAALGINRRHLSGFGRSILDCVYTNHDKFIDGVIERNSDSIKQIENLYYGASDDIDHSNLESSIGETLEAVNALGRFSDALRKESHLMDGIYTDLLAVKNTAFQEEQEVRVILNVPRADVSTRVSDGLIVPYVDRGLMWQDEIGTSKNDEHHRHLWCVVCQIWLGPRSDKRNFESLNVFGQFGWARNGAINRFDCGFL